MSHVARIIVLAAAAALLVGGAATFDARAVITEPLPADAPLAPPPIPVFPEAGETPPPADVIADPVELGAACGGWYQQSSYGGAWPAGSTWWEYQCSYTYPQCDFMCNADWGPYVWVDYFYWDGSNPVFYGEFFGDFYFNSMYSASGCSYWWDAPSSQWYLIQCPGQEPGNTPPTAGAAASCSGLSCSFDGSGSSDSDGTVVSYEWAFGDGTAASGATVEHGYAQPGTYTVTLTVTDDDGASASDTTAVAVTAPNRPPTAAFTHSCMALSCSFDASPSSDGDGTIEAYRWTFGDGTSGSGRTTEHSYGQARGYTITLTVTDDAGATGTESKTITLIRLTARGYRLRGLRKVDLSWSGPSGTSYVVYRNGARIATVQANAYTDTLNSWGSATNTYRVCAPAMSTCSNDATVTF
jgi:PKD repeat protein